MTDYDSTVTTCQPDAEKDPDSTADFQFRWAPTLGSETIDDSEFLLPDGLTEVASAFTDTTATIVVSGGSCGSTYRITNRITVGSLSFDKTIRVLVRSQ